ncbi:hypothetical protein B0T25DRAFT_565979 [Lasiosphaeria hispida]|uniref:Uncharacterized protein n=1 Tax=Lasiosphaeria hispida TaxID=260671 RepID=A0AAJ0MFF4_9PEZI|nr:hypothetical protein B0T25DRAFT_565979 [Lasiosphaeria hispida]
MDPKRTAYTGRSENLDQIQSATANISEHYFDKYIVDVEATTLGSSLSKYSDIFSKGYDAKFAVYERVVREKVPSQLDSCVRGAQKLGNFWCEETRGSRCKSGKATKMVDCPTDIPDAASQSGSAPNITYVLTNPDNFYKELVEI